MCKNIVFYQTRSGRAPFHEWLTALKDFKARSRIRTRLDRLKLGNFGDHRSIRHGIHELRIHHGPGYRIYYGLVGLKKIVLLCGGEKSTQFKDINLAYDYWVDYKERTHETI